jgi:hypothetical protein
MGKRRAAADLRGEVGRAGLAVPEGEDVMPKPLAVCLEDLDAATPGERYLRCVALAGRQPGLRVDGAGAVLWRSDEAVACELWVSADDRLILYRPEGSAPVAVRRAGRVLEVPFAKPVVLLSQDEFQVGRRRLRVHVHGIAPTVTAPALLPAPERPAARSGPRNVAAAVALGAALGGAALFEVRCYPPSPMPPTPRPEAGDAGTPPVADEPSDAGTSAPGDAALPPEIEVRDQPPQVQVTEPPPPPPPPPPEIEVREAPPAPPLNDK